MYAGRRYFIKSVQRYDSEKLIATRHVHVFIERATYSETIRLGPRPHDTTDSGKGTRGIVCCCVDRPANVRQTLSNGPLAGDTQERYIEGI